MSEPVSNAAVWAPPAGPPDPVSPLEPLVAAAIAGDRRSRDDLLATIHPLVLRYCRARLGRQETGLVSAEDVAQEVCVAVVNALATYQLSGRSFRAFVYGIAQHKVADTFRALGRNRTEPVAELPDVVAVVGGPEQHALDAEQSAMVGRLVHLLSPRQREVLVLRIVFGLSAEETAEIVGSTPGAVRVTQHRALNLLRGRLGPC
ncbi:MAG: RNA polymerase sigma factor ShbA [Pseudonocardia sp.]